jgi:hypothetical protein
MPFEPGQTVGDYEILSVLGKGGMGRVYRVRNMISNRMEAMKALLASDAEADLTGRFLSEIRILARLDHPNIAKFYTAFRHEDELLLFMEYVEGITLSERVKQGPAPLPEAVSYIRQALSALSYAHANSIIHRDIKPGNLMVTPQGVVKLMDFGIAKCESDPVLTRPGTTVGSLLYMSPEQIRGEGVDARSDLYSLGIVLYELTAGARPFEADSTFGILNAHLNTPPRPAIEANPGIPAAVNDLIMTALAKDPAQRFQSAEAFRKALDSIGPAGAQPTVTAPAAPAAAAKPGAGSTGKPQSRRALWVAAGAVACLCVLAAAAILIPRHESALAGGHSEQSQHVQQSQAAPAAPAAAPAPSAAKAPSAAQISPAAKMAPAVAPVPAPVPEAAQASPHPKPRAIQASRAVSSDMATQAQPSSAARPAPAPAPSAAAAKPGPKPEEIAAVRDDLVQLHARADAVNASLNRLSAEQASSGLGLRQDIAASASRMASYVQAADEAAGSNDIEAARRNIGRAQEELEKLETFLGR